MYYTVNPGDDSHIKAFGVPFDAANRYIWAMAAILLIGGYLGGAQDLDDGRACLGRRDQRRARKGSRRMSTAIELRGVEKSFGITSVIRNVNLTVAQGERHALIGPNGAGKSTLFNLISGYMVPSAGSILLRDEVVSGLPPYQINRRGLSRSFQVTNVFANMSVWENLRCAVLWAAGYRYAFWKNIDNLPEVRERTARILSDINLTARRDVPAGLLTYAEQRALEIGITIAGGANVILLDEPTAGMSHAETERAVALIRRLTEGLHAADRRARHERGVRPRRPHFGAGVRPDHRLGHAGGDPRQSEGQGSLSRRGGGLMLEVSDLHAYYGKSHILQGVDMRIDAGEVVSLLGRNGVGRSTTVKAIMGEVPPQGSILFKGSNIAGLPSYRIAHLGLGYVPEHRDIFPGLTVRQNLMLGIKDTSASRASGGSRTCCRCSPTSPPVPIPRPACCRAAKSRC